MQRYFLHFAYNGKNYHGWQFQKNTARTIQQVMQEKLSLLLHENIVLLGCGRTDTGVHAQQFYAHLESEKTDMHLNPDNWLFKMNRCLPRDIAVLEILPVIKTANARFSAVSRTYKYYIHTQPSPFINDTSLYLYGKINLELMNAAAEKILHTKDFMSFARAHNAHKTFICHVTEAKWTVENNQLIFTIKANRFLRNMVRAIVGTMLDVGTGKITLTDFDTIIHAGKRTEAGSSAAAWGLHLVQIEYPKEIFI